MTKSRHLTERARERDDTSTAGPSREELATVNNELREKVEELDRANDELTNLLNSTNVATIFLDTELRIGLFTPAIGKLLNLVATDVARPFRDFSPRFNINSDAGFDSLPIDKRRR